jgi:hypothetical protein
MEPTLYYSVAPSFASTATATAFVALSDFASQSEVLDCTR